jgi:hypothetical protein
MRHNTGQRSFTQRAHSGRMNRPAHARIPYGEYLPQQH